MRHQNDTIAWRTTCLLVLSASALLSGCGSTVLDNAEVQTETQTDESWPKTALLRTSFENDTMSDVHLGDGSLLSEGGDLELRRGKVLSLSAANDNGMCEKGIYDSLAEVPTHVYECPRHFYSAWSGAAYLNAQTPTTANEPFTIGLGLLAWDQNETRLYRVFVANGAYGEDGIATATIEYEPVDQ